MRYPNLFAPITLNKLTIRNRIISTAHAEVYAENGLPGERYIRYYEEKAKGGLGLAICGGSSSVSQDSPQGWWKSVDLSHDRVIEPLARLAATMHKHGAKIMIQATHMGRRSNYHGEHWPHLVTPSGVREPVHRGNAKVIEPHEMARIVRDFAAAARRVKQAGMDGIEISAAHQHLIDQFWSPRTNKRTDAYGGSLENRMRFGMEVLAAVRAEVGPDFCVGMRMCGDEFHEDGLSHDMLKEIAQELEKSGLIDFLSVIGSGADTHNTLVNCMPPMALPPEPFVHLANGIKSAVSLPVMHAQSIRDPVQAERILAAGMCDLVGMTRAHIADPHLVMKIRDGREDQIKQCVGANYCIDRQYNGLDVLCVQNAATSREEHMPHLVEKTAGRVRKVVVVGAGPAGLEAARVARERGHEVVLFEKNAEVGGQIMLAAKAPQREQMAGIVRWFDMETKRLGVDRRLGVAADAAAILAERPDIVVLATGGSSHTGQVARWGAAEGISVSSWDILSGRVAPGKTVLVYDGVSTQAGAGVADFLASRGSLVEIVTPDVKVADDVGGTTFPIFYRRMYAQGVVMTPNYWLDSVHREGDKCIAVLRNEYTEELEEREVDQVVIENGIVPNEGLYWELKERSANLGETDIETLYAAKPQPSLAQALNPGQFLLFRVGDCISMHNIHGAIYDALRLCKDF
ncbi:dimethylglycine catabolism A [Janthinobacterium sp. CG_23.3]|uniref:NADH:flavin oxidoreductase n=1 Tax=unclassified Janthinobacterium TaxID=2610881 RepID=UPI000347D3CF|nr:MULTISPECIES: NADH:flavin oxidoreductase [unclassified Janthinobacterium]MEC5162070.1 2,4-dienoyl-CoA reductase-like NADH-dependent reductase (Old Yellow Enzyme family)/NADPH-dependent 2,4-dienoyl-CoA reductase/sulfur reductase-like enzyme [Janthinobacterium sp. CG_S6]